MGKQYTHVYKKLIYKDKYSTTFHKGKILANRVLKVGILIPNLYASYFIRLENYLSNFHTKEKISLFRIKADCYIDFIDQYKFDVIVIQRHAVSPKLADSLINCINKNRTKIIYEIDDNLFNISHNYYSKFSSSIKNIINNSSCVTTTNETLKIELLKLNKNLNVKVIKNRLNDKLWGRIQVKNPSPRTYTSLLYMGTKTHLDDLNLILPSLRKIALRHAIKLTVIGITDVKFSEDFIVRKHIQPNSQEYPYFVHWLKSQKQLYDIGLAPLLNNQLNLNKSNLKYLDYTGLGIPGVYSNIKPYSDSIKTFENGILVNNTEEAWYRGIENLISDKKLRRKLAINAVNDLNNNFLLEDDPYAYYKIICNLLNDE